VLAGPHPKLLVPIVGEEGIVFTVSVTNAEGVSLELSPRTTHL